MTPLENEPSGLRLTCRVALLLSLASSNACGGEKSTYYIPGSGTLPDCSDPPALNLDGTEWFDNGIVTILSEGCTDASVGEMFNVCALNWVFSQTDNDVEIVVDHEYRIHGRLCGDELSLRGGWWLPVEDAGMCTYAEDSADEVGIEAEGNVLTLNPDDRTMAGTLLVRGSCRAEYEAQFDEVPEGL